MWHAGGMRVDDRLALANGGALAARLAALAGKAQRGHELAGAEQEKFVAVSAAFELMREVVLNKQSYAHWAREKTSAATLVSFVVQRDLLGQEPVERMNQLIYLLKLIPRAATPAELGNLHDFFAQVADEVNAAMTTSGERFTVLG